VELADNVIETLVEQSDASPGMRQLQGRLETVLTRGLRRYLETEVHVCVTAEEALQRTGRRKMQRRIGFQLRPAPPKRSETKPALKSRGIRQMGLELDRGD
jgi:hypothetical protein